MKFLLDESADFALIDFLKTLGHDATAIAHDYPYALKDPEVLSIAQQEQRILITSDRDFGELIFRQQLPHAGIILFRLGDESLEIKTEWLSRVLTNYADQLTNFMVITERGVRVRKTRAV
jgi:predicted nuclease of predicted toxin-antitoxin system